MAGRIGAATCDHRPRAAIRSPLPVAGSSETLASAGYSATTATSGLLLDEIFEPHTSVTTTTPGQDASITFSIGTVTSGMRIALNGNPVGSNTNGMNLIDPNGTQLWG